MAKKQLQVRRVAQAAYDALPSKAANTFYLVEISAFVFRIYVTDNAGIPKAYATPDGDTVGPGSSGDNSVPRFDGLTGKLLQDSLVFIDDNNQLGVGGIPSNPIHLIKTTVGGVTYFRIDNTDTTSGAGSGLRIMGGTNIFQIIAYANASAYFTYPGAMYFQSTSASKLLLFFSGSTEVMRCREAYLDMKVPIALATYTVATVPSASASTAGAEIYVTDEAGGAVGAKSDGTNWRRETDRAIIS